jgi:hypothetical protein
MRFISEVRVRIVILTTVAMLAMTVAAIGQTPADGWSGQVQGSLNTLR